MKELNEYGICANDTEYSSLGVLGVSNDVKLLLGADVTGKLFPGNVKCLQCKLKVLLQRTWKLKLAWDDDVVESITREFLKWIEGVLYYIEKIEVPRYFGLSASKKSSIHFFVMQESFTGVSDKRLKTLDILIDEKGIFRLKTTVHKRDDFDEFRTPAGLPGEHPIVKRLVLSEHKNNAGVSYTLNALRERFRLLCGRRTIKSVLISCEVRNGFFAKPVDPPTASSPADRLQDAAVFKVTGLDFAGSVILKDNSKAWICIFTCAFSRAAHLELVTSLSTEAFYYVSVDLFVEGETFDCIQ
ncbi:uncharacterized protein [Parasteatoda tepidariorum]|uniref:uncharacterized protein n=1 Tax=Parasteatoda tepidariorum TaxID=114398 RepID=UPI0039BD407F